MSRLKRLAFIRTFSSISGLICSKIHTSKVKNLLAPRHVSTNASSNCFSTGQRASKYISTEPGTTVHLKCALDSRLENGCVDDQQDYRRWGNGGGTFHKSASIDRSAFVEIGAVVHSECAVGADCHIGSGAIIGPTVTIGQSTKIGYIILSILKAVVIWLHFDGISLVVIFSYNAALANCMIGDFCVIHSGVCIGQDGFGFFVDEQGNMVKKPQTLKVRIDNHVEIGANTCIDRGSWRDTLVGEHTKIDNLVQIGHNVVIGRSCLICGQVGVAGSVTIGDYVTLGGRAGIRDHVNIVSKVRLAANSCVTKDISEPGDYGGFPAIPIRDWRRQIATHRRTLK
ncbi:probable UDP-3-O-acylglucosamine N-acyltransferase 2, mitochondrial isoform X1 [Lycium barbarum]|uniref:probable UDP-3-O-acylglucosamine N-acyltransferase 2, mitochondrial isoform X1 n=1 Tax=Lycium barbarum TaxID=112863 RepID=UPI00293E4C5E|nr:probable UDP-3-O-acylglucosamine N-acyltransferase 2, mitochondrial isoform X1 [Lycium barbarum]